MSHEGRSLNIQESSEESFAEQQTEKYDNILEQHLGKPRITRDDASEFDPSRSYQLESPPGGTDGYAIYSFPSPNQISSKGILEANALEGKLKSGKLRSEDLNSEQLAVIYSQYKVHLQPQKEALPEVFDALVASFAKDEELRRLVPFFKASANPDIEYDKSGQALPEIVLYMHSQKNMEQVVDKLQEYMKEYEGRSNQLTPRFNYKVNDLIYVAQGGGDAKNKMLEQGVLDQFYDKNRNYAFRPGEASPGAKANSEMHKLTPVMELFASLDKSAHTEKQKQSIARLKQSINLVREGKQSLEFISQGPLREKITSALIAEAASLAELQERLGSIGSLHSPEGTVYTTKELERLVELAAKGKITVDAVTRAGGLRKKLMELLGGDQKMRKAA